MPRTVEGPISLGGILLLVGVAAPLLRLVTLDFVPWPYAFFPLLVWLVSVVMRGFWSQAASSEDS